MGWALLVAAILVAVILDMAKIIIAIVVMVIQATIIYSLVDKVSSSLRNNGAPYNIISTTSTPNHHKANRSKRYKDNGFNYQSVSQDPKVPPKAFLLKVLPKAFLPKPPLKALFKAFLSKALPKALTLRPDRDIKYLEVVVVIVVIEVVVTAVEVIV